MKSIIVYSRELKAQNLYPRRIISPPSPNKCCAGRMEALGRPRVDEQGRRFLYKRCKVCGFALRHFLDPVGTVLASTPGDPKARRALPVREGRPVAPPAPTPVAPTAAPTRKAGSGRHGVRPARAALGAHAVAVGRKSTARRRR